MGSDREQELARTATAEAGAAEQPAEPVGATLGLIAHVEHAALGDLTVCAVGFSGDLLDPEARRRFFTHLAESDVKCEHIGPTTELVTLATPPQRFD